MHIVTLVMVLLAASVPAWVDGCRQALDAVEAPQRLKTRGKPKRARWEKVDEVLAKVSKELESTSCTVTFSQLFEVRSDEVLFPITNSILKLSPEGIFEGVTVYTSDGDALGEFVGRALYQRSGGLYASKSYALVFFQYRGSDGELHSSGHDLLLDRFLVRWTDIRDRTVLVSAQDGAMQ